MRTGYVQDITGQATHKVVIVDETISGRYVLKQMPIKMVRSDGSWYLTDSLSSLFIRNKSEVKDIREEENFR